MTREAMQQALDALDDVCETQSNPSRPHLTIHDFGRYRLAAIGLREALAQPSEPFGYFRAEPFGWTDCAPDAEGAKALYEHPPLSGESK